MYVHIGKDNVPDQTNCVKMTEMLARIAVVFVAVIVRVPLIRILCVRVMGLMKRIVLHGLGSAFHAGCKQGNDKQVWNPRFHICSIHRLDSRRQIPVT